MGMKKEEEEDWCFECYEGGLLIVCDYKHCLKSYHDECVSEDKSVLGNDDPWFCRRHSCYHCKKSSRYQCLGCPNALCKRCINRFQFARIRGNKGLCHHCSKLALLGEEGMDVDSDGERVDFEDLETNEGLFFDYWNKVIKVKEKLTLEDLQSADAQIKKGRKYKAGYKLKDSDNEEEFQSITNINDDDDDDDGDHNVDDVERLRPKLVHKRKRSNEQKLVMHRGPKYKSDIPKSKSEIVSWASNCLLDFLASVGEDTSGKHELYKVASIINRYADENKLLHPEKPRKIVCDVKLKCLLGKKIVDKNKLVDLLEPHFPEYLESPEREEEIEETRCSPEQKEKISMVSCKNQRNLIKQKIFEERQEPEWAPQSRFAFIVSENIKLVYLKKSLVQELLKEPDTFESKIVGSFVRIKSDSGAGSRRCSFQLLPVTGINKTSTEEHSQILLEVSTLTQDISINLLSDNNFSEEECEDLRKKVKDGLIGRVTIVELEQKARTLHDNITKHWIVKELATLQNRIDRANEKGWRREFFECSERQRLLRTPEEQSCLLRKVPNVIPDMVDDEPIPTNNIEEDDNREQISRKSMLSVSESPEADGSNGENNEISSVVEEKEETKHNLTVKLAKEKKVTENQMNEILQEEKEETKHNQTVKMAEEKKVSENQMSDILQAEKKHGGIVSCLEGNYNPSTETCFLEVLSQQSYHVAPQVDDNILFECELFQNFQKWTN